MRIKQNFRILGLRMQNFQGIYLFDDVMMMMNCFCGMVDQRKAYSLIPSWGHCWRSSPSQTPNTLQAGFEHAQNLNSGLVH